MIEVIEKVIEEIKNRLVKLEEVHTSHRGPVGPNVKIF
jgi:hypothetical protein